MQVPPQGKHQNPNCHSEVQDRPITLPRNRGLRGVHYPWQLQGYCWMQVSTRLVVMSGAYCISNFMM